MSYLEWKDSSGYLNKEWRNIYNNECVLHRELAPALINYYPCGLIQFQEFYFNGVPHREYGPSCTFYSYDGSIECDYFYLHGEYLGEDCEGFWALWERLNHEQRKNPELLKCLMRYS
jgi:hypothetical protein